MDNSDFVLGASGRRIISQLPHIRKQTITQQQFEVDSFALKHTNKFAHDNLPGLDTEHPVLIMRCLYQNTADLQMMVGVHPEDNDVTICCGFSGSGFQFAPAIADYIAYSLTGKTDQSNTYPGLRSDVFGAMRKAFSPQRFFMTTYNHQPPGAKHNQ